MTHRHSVGRESLSSHLIKQQNRTEEDIDNIVDLHNELHKAFDHMEAVDLEDEGAQKHLQDCAIVVKEIEFRLQEAWGFERNEDCHSWWFQVPHCTCPVLDNWDYVGCELAVITGGCPIHSPDP